MPSSLLRFVVEGYRGCDQLGKKYVLFKENPIIAIGMIERYEFGVRWAAVRLLAALLKGRPNEVQQIVLVMPMGEKEKHAFKIYLLNSLYNYNFICAEFSCINLQILLFNLHNS